MSKYNIANKKFPYEQDMERIESYEHNERLYRGKHFDAFNMKVNDVRFSKKYEQLKYVVCNFASLLSKVCADFLFSEKPKFIADKGDQFFLDELVEFNELHLQNYESAVHSSIFGDCIYKIRIGKKNTEDIEESVLIEEISPKIYYPHLDLQNVRKRPEVTELAWLIEKKNERNEVEKFLRREIHEPGYILNELWMMEGNKVLQQVDLKTLLETENLPEVQETMTDFNWIWHVPNTRLASGFFGESDYNDIETLLYSLNNRVSKIDNILDKHSDPILALPEGVLDEHGEVARGSFHMFEKPQGTNEKPEYIVWNAELTSAFSQIDKLVEFLFLFSEVSPDVVGMGKGQSDSGRALKLRMLRTLAKVQRKRLYYDLILKDMLFKAQEISLAHGVGVNGVKLSKPPAEVSIDWQDGLPDDEQEMILIEQMRLDAGLSTTADALMRLDGLSPDKAEQKAKELEEGTRLTLLENNLTQLRQKVEDTEDEDGEHSSQQQET